MGQWVRSGHITKNQINLDLIEIIQLWTFYWTFYLNHLSPLWDYFEICQFLMIPGPFEYFSENGWSHKIKVFSMKE